MSIKEQVNCTSAKQLRKLLNTNPFNLARDYMGRTVLHHAKHTFVVREFVKCGFNIDCADYDWNTPLHVADDVRIVKALLKAGANPNECNSVEQTPLMRAHDVGVIKLLLEYGANINAVDSNGYNALSYQLVYPECKWLLFVEGSDVRDAEHTFIHFLVLVT